MVLHGQELGWVCLGSCGADVTINALALFFVTGSYDDPQPQKPFDTVSAPVRRRSTMPILQTGSGRQPGTGSSLDGKVPFIHKMIELQRAYLTVLSNSWKLDELTDA
jgi:hypothetical protein